MTYMYGEEFARDESCVLFIGNASLWFGTTYKAHHVGVYGILCCLHLKSACVLLKIGLSCG